jgi:predicted KAP-like P-loop ATPase
VLRFFATMRSVLEQHKVVGKKVLKGLVKIAGIAGQLAGVPGAASASGHVERVLGAVDLEVERARVVQALGKQARRIIVVVDDVDRLTGPEARELFRVIKAVANFPNTTYLLAFDHDVVAEALGEVAGISGAAYIEKIVQAPFQLPQPDKHLLHAMFLVRLNEILADTPDDLFDQEHWVNVFSDAVAPFLETPRHVVRLANCLAVTYPAVDREVSPEDFVAIEAIRLFRPKLYDLVRKNQSAFVGIGRPFSSYGHNREGLRKFHDAWLQGEQNPDQVRKLVVRLFPEMSGVWGNTSYGHGYYSEWRRRCRICAPESFATYFRLAVPDTSFSRREMMAIIEEAADADAFASRLVALAQIKRPDGLTRARSFLEAVEDFTGEMIPLERVPPMITGLLRAGDELDVESDGSGMFDFGNDIRVMRVFLQLARRLEDGSRTNAILSAVRRDGCGLATALDVLRQAAHDHGLFAIERETNDDESPLIDREATEKLAEVILENIRALSNEPGKLARQRRLPYIMSWWSELSDDSEPREWLQSAAEDDSILLVFLDRLTRRSRRQSLGSKFARIHSVIDPEDVARFLRVEDVLARIDALEKQGDLDQQATEVITRLRRGKALRDRGIDPVSERKLKAG